MRSILREKSQDFFCILQYDRSNWLTFWEHYCQENREFMGGYTKTLDLNTTKIESVLNNTERPFLDKIKQKNEQIKHLKQRAAKTLNLASQELELSKEDFVIYLIGALGIKDTVTFERNDQLVVLIDIVSLYKNQRLEELQAISLFSAKEARKTINDKTQEEF